MYLRRHLFDPAHAPASPGVFSGCEAQITRKVAAGGKAGDITDEADKRGGRQQPHTGDRAQECDDGSLGSQRRQVLFHGFDARFQFSDLQDELMS
jgi:hypothetical protein